MTAHAKLIIVGLALATCVFGQRGARVPARGGHIPARGGFVSPSQNANVPPSQNANFLSPYRAMPAPANAHRFGNILFPGGTTTVPAVVNGPIWPFGGPAPVRHGGSRRGGRTVVVPYAVPIYAGGIGYGSGYYGYDYAPPQQPVTVVVPQAPPPTVIINNHFGDGEAVRSSASVSTEPEDEEDAAEPSRRLKVYEAPKPAPNPAPSKRSAAVDESPNIYLLVGRDGTMRQAIGYWVRDGRVHYVTANAEIRQVGVDELDLEASERVNAQRGVPFDLRRLVN